VELEPVTKNKPGTISTFLTLGRDYLSKSQMPANERERFLQSILKRQGEADRWLLLLKHQGKTLGFVHMKIDKNERLGWGFILEFYIVPDKRRLGWGGKLFILVRKILQDKGVQNIWLLASPPSDSFWRSLGFQETGETEDGQKVMVLFKPTTS
jgi:N-acetylglutamate synthase-like GNAT family acetyltransferase